MDEAPPSPREPAWSAIFRSTDFYRDILVTILGVLIALWIGEIADNSKWNDRAAEASKAIDTELSVNAATFQERSFLQPCLQRRVGEIRSLIAAARRGTPLPDIGTFGATPYRTLESAAWDDALSSGAMAHMADRQKAGLAAIYPSIKDYDRFVMEEQMLWYKLRLIEHAPGPLPESLASELATSLQLLTYRVTINGLVAESLLRFTDRRGIEPAVSSIFGEKANVPSLRLEVAKRRICQPLGAASA